MGPLLSILLASLALDDPAPPKAEALFEEGQRRYEQGDYAAAIEHFSRSYELFPAPILIFDIAQAHRRLGDCRQALLSYRRFLRAAPPDARERALAEAHMATLAPSCPDPAAAASPRSRPVTPPPPEVQDWRRAWFRFGALAVGLAAGAAATASALDGRAAVTGWQIEDRALAAGTAGTNREALDAWVARQRSNDRLATTITRRQRLTLALGSVAVVGLLAGTILSFPTVWRW